MPSLSKMLDRPGPRQASKSQSPKQQEYRKFFKAKLKEKGVSSPSELSDEEKKKFFDEVDKEWKGKGEKPEKPGPADRDKTTEEEKKGDAESDRQLMKILYRALDQSGILDEKHPEGEVGQEAIYDREGFLSDDEADFLESRGHTVVRAAELSIEGYLKGVKKALRKWARKDIGDEDKTKIKELLKVLK